MDSWGLYIIEENYKITKQNKLKFTHKHIIVKLKIIKYRDKNPTGKKAREKIDITVTIATTERGIKWCNHFRGQRLNTYHTIYIRRNCLSRARDK